ncbi:ogr/Delta-like zinc finger family protein [Photobacterium sp. CAU 1568]|uniref:Ogr/Delta-like zinc finger family protein n=2 Tax=Photobacterium arenosum TaxID=2774143 RepID=A0ABR9BTN7_9GAMM|nr:ogr/Delta-like zinc finger family protein [Photobacterium arenosum]
MRIYCQCGERAIISRSKTVDDGAQLSCSCRDPYCGHTFVSAVSYKHTLKYSAMTTATPFIRGSRIYCGCGERAIITKTNRLTIDCADMYCQCKNPECGHSFVMSQGFSHTLSPSSKSTGQLVHAIVRSLSPEQTKQVYQQLSLI